MIVDTITIVINLMGGPSAGGGPAKAPQDTAESYFNVGMNNL